MFAPYATRKRLKKWGFTAPVQKAPVLEAHAVTRNAVRPDTFCGWGNTGPES